MAQEKIDRLTQENALALAAGMSYGKWKAKQPVQQVQQIEAPTVAEQEYLPKYRLVCAHCGEEFLAYSRNKKYCSDKCKWKADYKRQQEKRAQARERTPDRKQGAEK